ncbi:Beta sliding clamp [bioreactor metagenome]|uniref:Beta sliding clamp n=1 Tax=bioreactor metagenome TaxID=1076179 RepID=A0A645GS85_9ZZZZ
MGTARDRIDAKIEGNSVEIGFNNKFLLDALKASDVDKVKIELNGSVSPITIVPEDSDHFLFLVLPVRLKSES